MTVPPPRISVVTPSYNQAAYLEATICSVLEQEYPEIEYIVVDGGSTDGSVEIIRRYEQRLAYWISEPDGGQAEAVNKGFARVTGEIVGWLNSDDLYCPGALATVARFFAAHPRAQVLYGNSAYIDAQGGHLGYYPARPYSRRTLFGRASGVVSDYIPQPSLFVRAEALRRTDMLDERLHFALDYDLWGQLARYYRFASISPVLSRYRLTATSKTSGLSTRLAAENALVLGRYGGWPSFGRALAYYFAVAAQRGLPAHQSVAELQALFSTRGLHRLPRGWAGQALLLPYAYAGWAVNALLPIWHASLALAHRGPTMSEEGALVYHAGVIPMRTVPPTLDNL